MDDAQLGLESLSAVIVAHDSAELIGRLAGSLPDASEITCVDNASSDDIAADLAPFTTTPVSNDRNPAH